MKQHKATKLKHELKPVEAALEEWAWTVGVWDAAKERLHRANEEMRAASAACQEAYAMEVAAGARVIDARQAAELASQAAPA